MPLYEYRCENCSEQFEVMQKFSDQPLTTHEKCGGKVNRLLSAPALQFKGSGWYVNDYAKKSGSSSSSNSSSNKDGGDNEKSKKSESGSAPAASTPSSGSSSSQSDKKSSDRK